MRSDMAALLVERPRVLGHGSLEVKGRRRDWVRRDPDQVPAKEPMSRGRGSKMLNENLSPLRRFLEAQVGKPWDRVYAQICEHVSCDSAVQKHVLEHLDQMVERNPLILRGLAHDPIARGGEHRPLHRHGRWVQFYVCPKSRLLRIATQKRRARKVLDPEVRELGPDRQARRIEGVWYEVTLAPCPEGPAIREAFDVVFHCAVANFPGGTHALGARYGVYRRYAVAKRQLSSREVRKLPPPSIAVES